MWRGVNRWPRIALKRKDEEKINRVRLKRKMAGPSMRRQEDTGKDR